MEAEKTAGQVAGQITEFVRGLSLRQRLVLGGGAAAVALTLWLFVRLIGEPHYVTLYSGLRPQEAQSLAARLSAKNIPSQMSPDGASLLVPADKLDASRLETAAQGLPRNARLGFELFDTPNWAGSDFTEKVNYQRALEGELERTLQTLGEVEAVRVHLVMPRESLFLSQEHEAKAAVIIKTRGGGLSPSAQRAIPQLVASAVDKLRPENVTVVDAESSAPLAGLKHGGDIAGLEAGQELAAAVVRTLEPVVGPEHVRASVHLEYDSSSQEDTQETYDPKATATLSAQRSEETAGGALPGGIPGTASNVPGAQPPGVAVNGTADADRQASRSESFTYAVSKSVRRTVQPPGRLKRITAAVLVDDVIEVQEKDGKKTSARRKRTADEMKEIEQLSRAALGIDAARGDLLAVENISFREPAAAEPPPPTHLERVQQVTRQWSFGLRYLGIAALFAVVYFLLLRPVKRQALAAFRELPARIASARAAPAETAGGPGAVQLPERSDEAARASALKRQLTDKVRSEPAAASRLVQNWMREERAR